MDLPKKSEPIKLERIIGIILLIPPTLSVVLFLLNLLSRGNGDIVEMRNLSSNWSGNIYGPGGGFTSATPIYFGLMAIGGAILLRGTDK
jgi:hypothetical protein